MKFAMGVFLMAASAFAADTVHEFSLPSIDGKPSPLSAYKGKVMLIVNVASRCGFTPQYTGLEALYNKYKGKGLVVVGFPANNFGSQEPGTNEEIKDFCTRKYNVTFPMYSKISVTGSDQAPLYAFLTKAGGGVNWNFTKFLVGKDGKVIKKFDSGVAPESPELTSAVEAALR
ncbi:MAG TPA: glutathione peroxidase [Solibacterales bacterium]|nr:glutathione peroxidase [Bryobacterales bacterium]